MQDGETPLHHAAYKGRVQVVGQLLGLGPAVDARNKVTRHCWM
jgi:ankyrin repeat protein